MEPLANSSNPEDEAAEADFSATPRDNAVLLARALVSAGSAIPVAGALFAFAAVIMESIPEQAQQRMQNFYRALFERVKEIQEEGALNWEAIGRNPRFHTAVAYALPIAWTTHHGAKLDALCYAVLNSGLRLAPEDDLQAVFFNTLAAITASHLRVLDFMQNTRRYLGSFQYPDSERQLPGLQGCISLAIPELANNHGFVDVIIRDLNQFGFLYRPENFDAATAGGKAPAFSQAWSSTMPADNEHPDWKNECALFRPHTSDWGDQFLAFVRRPSKEALQAQADT